MSLTIEERFNWLKNNKPLEFKEELGQSWEQKVNEIKQDMYFYSFNNPIYCGDSGMTDDEQRHILLDDLGVPR